MTAIPARLLLAAALAGATIASAAAPAAAPAAKPLPLETVIDAAPRLDPPPGAVNSYSVRWPYPAHARFVIDPIGRPRDIVVEPAEAPTEIKRAVTSALEAWRFWPALGACRYVEQAARVSMTFDEKRVTVDGIAYQPVTALRAVPTMDFAWLFPADAGDRRPRPRLAPTKLVDPVALTQPMPRYPAAASRKALPGWAFVLFEVDATGKPGRIVSSDGWSTDPKLGPQFAKEATNAVRRWKFKPASLGGAPQPRFACQRFMFNMDLGGR